MPTIRKGFRSRRGRPPQPTPAIDHGTPELAAHRAAHLTHEVIDRCHHNGIITDAQLRAALHFRWLYHLRFGRSTVQCLDISSIRQRSTATSHDSEWHNARQSEYRSAASALSASGTLAAVLRVAVFDDPSILHPTRPSALALQSRLREGLNLLHHHWKST